MARRTSRQNSTTSTPPNAHDVLDDLKKDFDARLRDIMDETKRGVDDARLRCPPLYKSLVRFLMTSLDQFDEEIQRSRTPSPWQEEVTDYFLRVPNINASPRSPQSPRSGRSRDRRSGNSLRPSEPPDERGRSQLKLGSPRRNSPLEPVNPSSHSDTSSSSSNLHVQGSPKPVGSRNKNHTRGTALPPLKSMRPLK